VITFQCPFCSVILEFADERVGDLVKCKCCCLTMIAPDRQPAEQLLRGEFDTPPRGSWEVVRTAWRRLRDLIRGKRRCP
jgi:hypothetical protein